MGNTMKTAQQALLGSNGSVKHSREAHFLLLKPHSETGLSNAMQAGEALVIKLFKEDNMTKYKGEKCNGVMAERLPASSAEVNEIFK